MNIDIQALLSGLSPQQIDPVQQPDKAAFDAALEAVEQVDDQQTRAGDVLSALASGESVDLHGTFVELEKAEITLRAMVSVRDKVVHAYEQIMNMGI